MKIYPPPVPNTIIYNFNCYNDNNNNNNNRLTINDAFKRWRLLIDDKIRLRSFSTILTKKYYVRIQLKTLHRWLKFVKQSKRDDNRLTIMYCEYKNINRILKKWMNLNYLTRLKSENALLDLGSLLHSKILILKYFKKLLKLWQNNREIRHKITKIIIMIRMIHIRNGYFKYGLKKLNNFHKNSKIDINLIMKGKYHNEYKMIKKAIIKWRRWCTLSLYTKSLIRVIKSKYKSIYSNSLKNISSEALILATKLIKYLYRKSIGNRLLREYASVVIKKAKNNIIFKYFGEFFFY